MTEIAFTNIAGNRVTYEGDIQGDGPWTLVRSHQNQPNFRIEMDGTITLVTTIDVEFEGFGELLI